MPWRYSGAINFSWQKNYASAIIQFFSFNQDGRLSDYALGELESWLANLLGYSKNEADWFDWKLKPRTVSGSYVGEGWQTMDWSETKGVGLYYAVMRLEDNAGRTIARKKIHLRSGRRGTVISSAISEVASWFLRRVGFR